MFEANKPGAAPPHRDGGESAPLARFGVAGRPKPYSLGTIGDQ